jgi:hypothetical protein
LIQKDIAAVAGTWLNTLDGQADTKIREAAPSRKGASARCCDPTERGDQYENDTLHAFGTPPGM